jgi:histidinol-phosphate phosphatase family protein
MNHPHAMQPALFFDRDGVINESPGDGYILTPGDFHLRPGIGEAMRVGQERGYPLFVVTNQRCVGKGLLSPEGLHAIHDTMRTALAGFGVRLQHIFAYTGLPKDGYGAKPRPDFLHEAARLFPIDLAGSWVMGDQDKDLAMGRAAGVARVILVPSDKPAHATPDDVCPVESLAAYFTEHLPVLPSR